MWVRAPLAYLQQVILLLDLCLETDFCSGDHSPLEPGKRKDYSATERNQLFIHTKLKCLESYAELRGEANFQKSIHSGSMYIYNMLNDNYTTGEQIYSY